MEKKLARLALRLSEGEQAVKRLQKRADRREIIYASILAMLVAIYIYLEYQSNGIIINSTQVKIDDLRKDASHNLSEALAAWNRSQQNVLESEFSQIKKDIMKSLLKKELLENISETLMTSNRNALGSKLTLLQLQKKVVDLEQQLAQRSFESIELKLELETLNQTLATALSQLQDSSPNGGQSCSCSEDNLINDSKKISLESYMPEGIKRNILSEIRIRNEIIRLYLEIHKDEFTFVIHQYSIRKFSDSPPMYTHPGGYEFKIRVYTKRGVLISLIPNWNDEHQPTHPNMASFIISLQLVDTYNNKDHYTKDFQMICAGVNLKSYEVQHVFISHTSLREHQTQYIDHDSLTFRVTKIKMVGFAQVDSEKSDRPPYDIVLLDMFDMLKQGDYIYTSPLCTHPDGNKFRLGFQPQNRENNSDTSLAVKVLPLDHSTKTKRFKITLELLHQKESKIQEIKKIVVECHRFYVNNHHIHFKSWEQNSFQVLRVSNIEEIPQSFIKISKRSLPSVIKYYNYVEAEGILDLDIEPIAIKLHLYTKELILEFIIYPYGKSSNNIFEVILSSQFINVNENSFPARNIITLELLNQHRDQDHFSSEIRCTLPSQYDFFHECLNSFSIPPSLMPWNDMTQTQFLKNKSLEIRVSSCKPHQKVEIGPKISPEYTDIGPPYEITFCNYTEAIKWHDHFYSPPLYTHFLGHIFQVRVIIFPDMMQAHVFPLRGVLDDILTFPALYSVTIELLSQGNDHVAVNINCYFTEVKPGETALLVGYKEVKIDRKTKQIDRLIKNDCVKLRVYVTKDRI